MLRPQKLSSLIKKLNFSDDNKVLDVKSLLGSLLRLWGHIGQRRQLQFGLLLGLMLVSAFMEIVSLGAVLPFLGILISPARVFAHPIISDFASTLGITSADQLALPITVVFISLALLAGAIRILLLWANTRLAVSVGTELSVRVYRYTLYQPYSVHVARNSSSVISSVVHKVEAMMYGILLPTLTFISSILLVVTIMVTFFIINPLVAVLTISSFGTSYGLITWYVRNTVKRNGARVTREQTQVIKALQEGLLGIRDILLNGAQQVYCDLYNKSNSPLRKAEGNNLFISSSPRFAMEAIGVALIAIFGYFLSAHGNIANALPFIGAFVLGAQRLLPALQYAYSSWTTIISALASLAIVLNYLDQKQPTESAVIENNVEPISFHKTIRFDSVGFRYSDSGPWVLNDLSLTIAKGIRVGFVGSTGSGKSTALDLLMGLLTPSVGQFLVDDQPISGNRVRGWQKIIAHVPQRIYLSDSTMAENIAFGIPPESIDFQKVRQAARQAQIADFIENQPEGYNAIGGEHGVRLSGGQLQRIGIARALYKQARVLILDEATSALDSTTEKSVMEAIKDPDRDLTILIIAHRINTVKNCDKIIQLEDGRILAQGTYKELLECSPSFRQMAEMKG